MSRVTAIFEHGTFRPETTLDLPEGARVQLAVEALPSDWAPLELSVEERRAIRHRVTERMLKNPLPPDAPRFTRDEMYDCG